MSIAIIIGGQYGSEGKGKVSAHLCRHHGYNIAVRCGGPNSGHTVTINGEQIVLRQIPAGVVKPNTKLYISAGCLLNLDVLLKEIEIFDIKPDRLRIDRNAVIIKDEYIKGERESLLDPRIGSTCSGTGFAVADRVLRSENIILAKNIPELKPYIVCVSENVMNHFKDGKKIVIEGTQGFGLSVYHSPYYPFATSRDTTAAGFLSEVGISPLIVSDIIMVIRTFPIRVGGNSGPLPYEIDWKTVQQESNYPYEIKEYTSVTKRLRRVARFDIESIKKAILASGPTKIALMGLDYLDYKNKGVKIFNNLTTKTKSFIHNLEDELDIKIDFVGVGPLDTDIIDRINSKI